MSDLNTVALVGRIAKDAVVEQKNGKNVCSFTIAVNRDKKDENGEYKSIPNFIQLALFDDYGAKMAPHLYKGRTVSVEGSLKTDTWVKDNKSFSKLSVAVHKIGLAFPLPVGKHPVAKDAEGSTSFESEESGDILNEEELFEEEIV